jgi:hypothetical protein
VPKPSNLRELILRCRVLLGIATEPGTIEQLRLWVIELQHQSEGRGRSAVELEVPIGAMGPSRRTRHMVSAHGSTSSERH